MGRILSIILIGLSGYFIFQNRYRVMNVIFRNSFLRQIIVSSFMGIPGVRERILNMVFPTGSAKSY